MVGTIEAAVEQMHEQRRVFAMAMREAYVSFLEHGHEWEAGQMLYRINLIRRTPKERNKVYCEAYRDRVLQRARQSLQFWKWGGLMSHDFASKKKAALSAVHAEKDARKAVAALLKAENAHLREQFLAEKAAFDAAHQAAMDGLDAAAGAIDEAVSAVFANTGH